MKQTVTLSTFKKTFHDCGRGNQFSNKGLKALFEYLEALEEDTGEEIEFDVISLCCDFTEADNEEALRDTGHLHMDDLANDTIVIEVDDDTVIYQAF